MVAVITRTDSQDVSVITVVVTDSVVTEQTTETVIGIPIEVTEVATDNSAVTEQTTEAVTDSVVTGIMIETVTEITVQVTDNSAVTDRALAKALTVQGKTETTKADLADVVRAQARAQALYQTAL
jgi:hypothetical protein